MFNMMGEFRNITEWVNKLKCINYKNKVSASSTTTVGELIELILSGEDRQMCLRMGSSELVHTPAFYISELVGTQIDGFDPILVDAIM